MEQSKKMTLTAYEALDEKKPRRLKLLESARSPFWRIILSSQEEEANHSCRL